ncbi:MAG: hypothetical protein AB4368_14065 [Xenococcaceae cyanobacterium]
MFPAAPNVLVLENNPVNDSGFPSSSTDSEAFKIKLGAALLK